MAAWGDPVTLASQAVLKMVMGLLQPPPLFPQKHHQPVDQDQSDHDLLIRLVERIEYLTNTVRALTWTVIVMLMFSLALSALITLEGIAIVLIWRNVV